MNILMVILIKIIRIPLGWLFTAFEYINYGIMKVHDKLVELEDRYDS